MLFISFADLMHESTKYVGFEAANVSVNHLHHLHLTFSVFYWSYVHGVSRMVHS
jgi:hypothetical protein